MHGNHLGRKEALKIMTTPGKAPNGLHSMDTIRMTQCVKFPFVSFPSISHVHIIAI